MASYSDGSQGWCVDLVVRATSLGLEMMMGSKLRCFGMLVFFVGVLLASGSGNAGEVDAPWIAQGWPQWHPQQGTYTLGAIGTQLYFSPADPVIVHPPEIGVAERGRIDSDGDGVFDDRDLCPGTPLGTIVDASGCDPDPDGDGVRREDDRCPNTPSGVVVNTEGCWIIGKILFRFDKTDIQKQFKSELKKVSAALGKYPAMQVEIVGHTDSRGSEEYNQKLSVRRSKAVKKSLMSLGVSAERMFESGFGEDRPLNGNETAKERAMNRRVEILSKE